MSCQQLPGRVYSVPPQGGVLPAAPAASQWPQSAPASSIDPGIPPPTWGKVKEWT